MEAAFAPTELLSTPKALSVWFKVTCPILMYVLTVVNVVYVLGLGIWGASGSGVRIRARARARARAQAQARRAWFGLGLGP